MTSWQWYLEGLFTPIAISAFLFLIYNCCMNKKERKEDQRIKRENEYIFSARNSRPHTSTPTTVQRWRDPALDRDQVKDAANLSRIKAPWHPVKRRHL